MFPEGAFKALIAIVVTFTIIASVVGIAFVLALVFLVLHLAGVV